MHAGLGVLALNTRTNRMWKRSTVLGDAQHAAIEAWLGANAPNLRHLVVVSSIPPVHTSVAAALGLMDLSPVAPEPLDDLRDTWVAGNNRNELQRLMLRLFGAMKANPALRITIASGDVHVGTLAQIESRLPVHARPDGSRPRIHQIVSSGIGHPPPSGIAATLMSFATGGEMELGGEEFRGRLLSFPDQGSYVLSRRNFATISFSDPAGAWLQHGNVRVAFHAEGRTEPIVRRLLGT